VRSSLEDPHQRARVGAILAILGAVDIPLVVMATRWFRGMHPVSPEMEPSMRLTLLASVTALTALAAWLLVQRRAQLQLAQEVLDLQQAHAEDSCQGPILSAT
jgi:heme exporter protein C